MEGGYHSIGGDNVKDSYTRKLPVISDQSRRTSYIKKRSD